MRRVSPLLLLAGLALGADPIVFDAEPFACPPFEVKFGKPQGWEPVIEGGVLVLHRAGSGVRVTREPFLYEIKEFQAAWEKELAAGGVAGSVKALKVGRNEAVRASYELDREGKRGIEIWRVRVPESEMLYNFTFSLPSGGDMKTLVEGVLKPFSCTAPPPKLEFQATPTSIGAGLEFKLPVGYAKADGGYVKLMPGYGEQPREAGRISLTLFRHDTLYRTTDGKGVTGSSVDEVTELPWAQVSEELQRADKLRGNAARYGVHKGHLATAGGLAKDGSEKAYFAFGTKLRGVTLVFTLLVDARETRLHKNLFKEFCETVKERS
ncbi:MAG: hypothetical protein ACT4PV_15575 [Planctomycetaceae bacterium]